MAILLSAPAVEAQAPASLEGMVFSSSSGRTIAGAWLALEDGPSGLTDAAGRFLLSNITPGEYRLAIVTPGCAQSFSLILLQPVQVRRIGFQVEYEEAKLDYRFEPTDPTSQFITARDISEMRVQTMSDVLRRVAPSMVGVPANQPGSSTSLSGRNRASGQGSTPPIVVLDGIVLGNLAVRVIDDIDPNHVGSIEISRGAAGGWAYGTGGAGGVVKIVTKGKLQEGDALKDSRTCEIRW